MNGEDVKRIVLKNKIGIFVNWHAIAKELTTLTAKEYVQQPEPIKWWDMTWVEREERIRAIIREEIKKAQDEFPRGTF